MPIIWDCEKNRYAIEYLDSWLNGLLIDFKAFLKGYWEGYQLTP
jgi:hypothetical protein